MPPLVGWNNWPEVWSDGTPCELSSELGYIIYSSSGSFFVPMGIIIFVYLSIFHRDDNTPMKSLIGSNVQNRS